MVVSVKIQSQFWNTKAFLRNGWEMSSQWREFELQLNSDFFQRQQFSIIPNKINYFNSRILNIGYIPQVQSGYKYSAYDVTAPFNSVFAAKSASGEGSDTNPFDTWLSLRFTQDAKTKSIKSTREAFANTF